MPEGLPRSKVKGKKWVWIAGGAGLFGVFYYLRKRKQAQQSTTDTTGNVTDTSAMAVDPNAIDPSTGMSYASEGYGGGYLGGVYGSPYGGTFYGSQTQTTTPTRTVTTNAEWAQASEAYLTTLGYHAMPVAVALGKYLSGQGLTNDQFNIVETAIGFEGTPPTTVPPPHKSNPGGGQGKKTITTIVANGQQDCRQIAVAQEMTVTQLIFLNPNLAPIAATTKHVKTGTRVRVYSQL